MAAGWPMESKTWASMDCGPKAMTRPAAAQNPSRRDLARARAMVVACDISGGNPVWPC